MRQTKEENESKIRNNGVGHSLPLRQAQGRH
jgi:hypothetical protein